MARPVGCAIFLSPPTTGVKVFFSIVSPYILKSSPQLFSLEKASPLLCVSCVALVLLQRVCSAALRVRWGLPRNDAVVIDNARGIWRAQRTAPSCCLTTVKKTVGLVRMCCAVRSGGKIWFVMQELSRQPRTNFPGYRLEFFWVDALGLTNLLLHTEMKMLG